MGIFLDSVFFLDFFQILQMSFFWCCCVCWSNVTNNKNKQNQVFVGSECVSIFWMFGWFFTPFPKKKHIFHNLPIAVEKCKNTKINQPKNPNPSKVAILMTLPLLYRLPTLQLEGLMILRAQKRNNSSCWRFLLHFEIRFGKNLPSMTLWILCDHPILLQNRACIANHPYIRV